MAQVAGVQFLGPGGDGGAPAVQVRDGRPQFAECPVVHQVEEFGLARDVGVEGHGGAAEPFADGAHRERGHAVRVGDRDAGGDDRVDAEARFGAAAPGARLRWCAPEQGQGPVGVALSGVDDHTATPYGVKYPRPRQLFMS